MIKERLKELDIKISELADYLKISRPTLYKFIELYDSGNKRDVNKKIVSLFDYIENNSLIGKGNVIGYILDNIAIIEESEDKKVSKIIKSIREYILANPDSEKTQFMGKCSQTDKFDIAIHYLMEVNNIKKLKTLNKEQSEKLEFYKKILDLYK